ncbi:hypothetical protein MMC06_003122 [Schaereria dolodes]|nr:hypothetical protein [Schaereria dolodes]
MKTFFLTIMVLTVSIDALIARNGNCCFQINAAGAGGAEGSVGQLPDGQNRVGGGLTPATYCIDSNGAITDESGRGCILTSPTTQFQCDSAAAASPGFSIGCDGTLSFNGSTHFYECATGQNHTNNIYYTTTADETGCFEVSLGATSCGTGCASSTPSPPASTFTPSTPPAFTSSPRPSVTPAPPPAPTTGGKTCPTDLSTPYQYPHLIIPVYSNSPDTADGTSYDGNVNSTTDSLFVFDIPASYSGLTCTLLFFLPNEASLSTSSYTLTGSGEMDFAKLSSNAAQSTTWNTKPSVESDYGPTLVKPGSSNVITSFSCPAGTQDSFQISSAQGTSLEWFQDYNSPA